MLKRATKERRESLQRGPDMFTILIHPEMQTETLIGADYKAAAKGFFVSKEGSEIV